MIFLKEQTKEGLIRAENAGREGTRLQSSVEKIVNEIDMAVAKKHEIDLEMSELSSIGEDI